MFLGLFGYRDIIATGLAKKQHQLTILGPGSHCEIGKMHRIHHCARACDGWSSQQIAYYL